MKEHPMYKEPPEGIWEFLDIVVLLRKQSDYARLRRRKRRRETKGDRLHRAGLARQAKRKWRKK